jgi:hypothetical protein
LAPPERKYLFKDRVLWLMQEQKAVSSFKNWSLGFCAISNRFKNVNGLLYHIPELGWTLN